MPSQRILAATPATLRAQFADSDGEPTTLAGPVTVTVTRGDGTALVTDAAATASGSEWTYPLTPAQTAALDELKAVWTTDGRTVTTFHEIVGGFFFTVADLRSLPEMGDAARYPDAAIRDVRRRVEDTFEDATGVAWVPRYSREPVTVTAGRGLLGRVQVRLLRHASTSTATLTAAQVDAAAVDGIGQVSGLGLSGLVTVGYEHGYDSPPADLKDAALTFARSQLIGNRTGIPDRAMTFTSAEGGTYRLATPGIGGWITGIPEVDEVLHRYDHRVPGVG